MNCFICGNESNNGREVYHNDSVDSNKIFICNLHNCHIFKCRYCEQYFYDNLYNGDGYYGCCNGCVLSNNTDYEYTSIHDYSMKPRPIFRGGNPSANQLVMGIELETADADDGDDVDNFSKNLDSYERYGYSFFYGKEDCSLDDFGVEIVSHPATLEFHKSTDMWKRMLQEAKDAGLKSNDTNCCGIHIHVNKDYFTNEQINKLDAIVNRISRTFRRFARRNSRDYARYSPDKQLEQLGRNDNGRYSALNINSRTIEFRIFKGNLKYESIMALFELVQGTCDFVKQDNIDVQFFFQERNIINRTFKEYLESRNFEYLPAYTEMCRVWRDLDQGEGNDNEESSSENN